jgi:serine/threonine protein phosphatase PrpC
LHRNRPASELLTAKEASESSTRHVLSRSLGTDLFVNVETSDIQVYPGDVLLLCCDGLYHSVPASEMAAVAGHGGDLNVAAQRLVDIANDRDGSDNISVQLIRVRSVERVGMYRGRPYKLR